MLSSISYLNLWFKHCGSLPAVTYEITVRVSLGEAVVSVSGDVPDGIYQVTGSEDDRTATIGVERRTPDGEFAQQAHHTIGKEQE